MSPGGRRISRPVGAAAVSTCLLAAGQLCRFPHLVRDGVSGSLLPDFYLEFPLAYTLTAPFSATADFLTFNSVRQHVVWAIYLLLAYWVVAGLGAMRSGGRDRERMKWGRAIGGYPIYLAAVMLFLAWGAAWPRPSARLVARSPADLIVDFHSHTIHSHDGRRLIPAFTPEENMRWHRRQGFDASFITDHNKIAGAAQARAASRETGYRSLAGEELSLHDSHIIVLGNEKWIDNREYGDGLAGIKRFLGVSRSEFGALAVLSLPEYWKHHWPRVEEMIEWGAAGIELVNGAPKTLDFPAEKRDQVVELARKHDIFLCGVSDSHGWGSAAYAWNALGIPGHTGMGPDALERAVLKTLSGKGFQAVTIVTRIKNPPATGPAIALDPIVGLWTLLRSLPPAQAASTLIWIWVAAILLHRGSRRHAHRAKPKT